MKRSAADRWGLGVAVALAAAALLLLLSSVARAQPGNPARPELPELTIQPCPDLGGIDADGPVVHFPRTTADCMLAYLRQLPEVVDYARLLERRIEHDDVRIGLRDREVALAARQADVATESLETALRRAREAEERLDAWYRQPVFLLGLGAALAVVVEVVAILVVRKLVP